jgi:ribosome modulation factor
MLLSTAALAADGPPNINLEPSCRVAAAGVTGRNHDACIKDENTARDKLNGRWKEFSAKEKQRCTELVHMGGPPSYVELLTCLEMAEQAKQIPDRDLLNTKNMKLMD